MSATEQVRGDILLGILELSPAPLSPSILSQNFDVDADRMADAFEQLVSGGYASRVESGYYEIAPEGKDRVLMRSAAD